MKLSVLHDGVVRNVDGDLAVLLTPRQARKLAKRLLDFAAREEVAWGWCQLSKRPSQANCRVVAWKEAG